MREASGRSVYALDNVRLELPVATAGSRTLAATVDYTLLGVVLFAVIVGGSIAVIGFELFDLVSPGWIVALVILASFVVELGYFLAQELLLGGQTLGKRLLGLRVVSHRGGRASPLAIVLRNLTRTLDLLFGMWFLVLDPRGRRIGDRLGGTLVVHELVRSGSSSAVSRAPAGWGPERIQVVEGLLQRLELLSPSEANSLARRILRLAAKDDPSFPYHRSGVSPSTLLMQAFGRASPGALPEVTPAEGSVVPPPPPPPASSPEGS